jgi:orotate phosphoribosyltransferase
MNWREEIKKFLISREGEVSEGEPRLYVDVKAMISRPKLLYEVIAEMGDLILKNHSNIKAIGSHGVGGSFLVSPIMLYVYNHWFDVNGFFVRLDAEEEGKRNPVEGFLERGWRVLIVDTMIKTGRSSLRAHEILRNHGFHVDGMIVVVDLSHGDNACTRAGLKVESLITL